MTRCGVLAAASLAILSGIIGCNGAAPPPQPTPTPVVPAASNAAVGEAVVDTTTNIYVTDEQLLGIKVAPQTTQLVFQRLDDTSPGFLLSFPTSKPAACQNAPTEIAICKGSYTCDLNLAAVKSDRVYYKLAPNPKCPGTKSKQIPFSVVHCGRGC